MASPAQKRRAVGDAIPAASLSALPDDDPTPPDTSAEIARWEEEEKIRDILGNEENAGAKLEVYRKDVHGRWAYLDMLGLEEWSPEARANLARAFGGGDYKVRVRKAIGTYGESFTFTIDKAIRPRDAEGNKSSEVMELVKMQKAEANSTLPMFMTMMQQMMQQQQAAQAQMTQVLVAAMQAKAVPVAGPSDKLLELAFAKLSQTAPALDLSKLIGALKDLRDLAGRGGGGSGPRENAPRDDGFWSGLFAQLPTLLSSLSQMQGGVPPPAASAAPAAAPKAELLPPPSSALTVAAPVTADSPAAVPPPAPVTPSPSPEEAARQKAENNKAALRMLLDHLLPQAVAGTDPALVAGQVSASLDDENFTALAVVLQREDWLAILAEAHEGAAMQSPWLLQWRQAVLAEIEPEKPATP